jgi:pSer/pThr/pTyr-binding forkhead associated (FHA) protein
VRGILVIGRAPECELHLADRKVSRRHAILVLGRDSLIVQDDDSLNGTWVNDRRILDPVVARGGDRIRVGGSEFVVRESDDDADEDPERAAPGAGFEGSLTVPVPGGVAPGERSTALVRVVVP